MRVLRFISFFLLFSSVVASASDPNNLTIKVVDPQNAAIFDARVLLSQADQPASLVVQSTSAEGKTVFVGLSGGEYRVRVLAPGFAEELDKTAQAQKEKKAELSPKITGNTPAPKDPMWEIRVLRDQWNTVLKNGPVDQNGQHYGMPIEMAKEQVLKELEQHKKKAGQ